MKSKLWLIPREGKRLKAEEPFQGADHAVVDGPCPHCGCLDFKVAGTGRRIASDDRAYEADAIAYCCNAHVGTLRLEVNTLFGLREDEAVGRMGVRIY